MRTASWVDLGLPCLLCVLDEPHEHAVMEDGSYGIVVRTAGTGRTQ